MDRSLAGRQAGSEGIERVGIKKASEHWGAREGSWLADKLGVVVALQVDVIVAPLWRELAAATAVACC